MSNNYNTPIKGLEIAVRNSRSSPLLRLPAELRNQIFEYVLSEPAGISFAEIRYGEIDRQPHTFLKDFRPRRLALLGTCRQIHSDTKLLPFTLNTFGFRSLVDFGDILISNRLTAEQRSAIKTIRIGPVVESGAAVKDFLFWARYNRLSKLRDLLPSIKSVELICFYVQHWEGTEWHEILFRRDLRTWLEGQNKEVKVTFGEGEDLSAISIMPPFHLAIELLVLSYVEEKRIAWIQDYRKSVEFLSARRWYS